MATQGRKPNEQPNQAPQGQSGLREAQQRGAMPRRGLYAVGLPLSPIDFFRMDPFSIMRRMMSEAGSYLGEGERRKPGELAWVPAVEVMERKGNYVVRAELPGLNPNDVKLEITEDAIVIQGERKMEQEETRGDLQVTERRYGKFYRAIPLPEGAKADEARAKFENGVLEITVPLAEQRPTRLEIPIQAASEGGSEKAA